MDRTQIGVGAAALVAAGGIDVLAHLGPTGLVIGGIAAYVAYRHAPDVLGQGEELPALPSFVPVRYPGSRSFADRLLGRFPEEEEERIPDEHNRPKEQEYAPLESVFPLYPEEDTLRLGRVLATGQRFDPHFNGLVGQGIIITAVQGAGKSQLNGRIIEQSGKCGVPAIVFDHKGEYDTVTELDYVHGLRVGATPDDGFVLSPENADEFVETVMRGRHQAIINLPSYGDNWLARAKIVAAVGKSLMFFAEKQRLLKKKLLPCLVLLDEAQLYIPQDTGLLPPEAQENKVILAELKNAFFALVSNGRSNGYTVGLATQSLTYIAKWAIKSCQIQVFGRHAEKNALDMCEDIIDASVATREEIRTFPSGVGVVIGFTRDPMVVKFDKKESRDESETPKIERLRERYTSASPLIMPLPRKSPRQLPPMEELPLPRPLPEVRPATAPKPQPVVPTPTSRSLHRDKYTKAIEVWHLLEADGLANVRTFASSMGINDTRAYNLLCEMEKLHLITWDRKRKRGA